MIEICLLGYFLVATISTDQWLEMTDEDKEYFLVNIILDFNTRHQCKTAQVIAITDYQQMKIYIKCKEFII